MSAKHRPTQKPFGPREIACAAVAGLALLGWITQSDLTASSDAYPGDQPTARLQAPDFNAVQAPESGELPSGFVFHPRPKNNSESTEAAHEIRIEPVVRRQPAIRPSSSPLLLTPASAQNSVVSESPQTADDRTPTNGGSVELNFLPIESLENDTVEGRKQDPQNALPSATIVQDAPKLPSAEALPSPQEVLPDPEANPLAEPNSLQMPDMQLPDAGAGLSGENMAVDGGAVVVPPTTTDSILLPTPFSGDQGSQNILPGNQVSPPVVVQPEQPIQILPETSAQEIPFSAGPTPSPHLNTLPQPNPATPVPSMAPGHVGFGHRPGTSGFRATVEMDSPHWLQPFQQRAEVAVPPADPLIDLPGQLPPNLSFWWETELRRPLNSVAATHQVDVASLLHDALQHSPQVLALKAEPEIQRRIVIQEEARFDWTAFLESEYNDLNDPVGNELTTGTGEDRLLTRKATVDGGFRRRNAYGGELELRQQLSHENQNSRFFLPNNQGATRLELSYRQPLLNGSGLAYNQSEIVLARIDANSSEDDVVSALQDHLVQVTESYWTLYRSRAGFLQRQRLLMAAKAVLRRLEGRAQVDTIPRQVLRAKAAVARAQTRIQRTLARVRNAESQLRLLVNSPLMLNAGPTEVLPMEPPRLVTETAPLQSVLQTALVNRPDISQAIRRMRAAGVRLGVSQNELLPKLDLIVETYVADLAGNSNVHQALAGQVLDNRPGYTVGLNLEIPLGNRFANATLAQRQWELKRSINVFRATVEKSLTDVEIAEREVHTAYSEMISRYESLIAADNESRYLQDRFEVLPSSEESATLLLEDLLDSYERRADEEALFVQAQVDHAVALIRLKQELGILLRSRHDRPQLDQSNSQWIANRLSDKGVDTSIAEQSLRQAATNPEAVPVPTTAKPRPTKATDTPVGYRQRLDEKGQPSGQPKPAATIKSTSGHSFLD